MIFEYKGHKIHYECKGSGPAMILLHGWGCTNEIWAQFIPLLSQKFSVFSLDFPGFGESDEPSTVWGTADYADMLEAFCREYGIVKPSLVGHSFGGRVSIQYASSREVDKLVLVDAAGITPKRSLRYYYKVYTFKLLKKAAKLFLPAAKAEALIARYRGKSASADYNNASPRMRAILSKVVNEDLKRIMPQISAPTLLFWGDADTATPLSDAQTMEKLIPDAGLVTVPGAGHFSFLQAAGLFSSVLSSFFKIA